MSLASVNVKPSPSIHESTSPTLLQHFDQLPALPVKPQTWSHITRVTRSANADCRTKFDGTVRFSGVGEDLVREFGEDLEYGDVVVGVVRVEMHPDRSKDEDHLLMCRLGEYRERIEEQELIEEALALLEQKQINFWAPGLRIGNDLLGLMVTMPTGGQRQYREARKDETVGEYLELTGQKITENYLETLTEAYLQRLEGRSRKSILPSQSFSALLDTEVVNAVHSSVVEEKPIEEKEEGIEEAEVESKGRKECDEMRLVMAATDMAFHTLLEEVSTSVMTVHNCGPTAVMLNIHGDMDTAYVPGADETSCTNHDVAAVSNPEVSQKQNGETLAAQDDHMFTEKNADLHVTFHPPTFVKFLQLADDVYIEIGTPGAVWDRSIMSLHQHTSIYKRSTCLRTLNDLVVLLEIPATPPPTPSSTSCYDMFVDLPTVSQMHQKEFASVFHYPQPAQADDKGKKGAQAAGKDAKGKAQAGKAAPAKGGKKGADAVAADVSSLVSTSISRICHLFDDISESKRDDALTTQIWKPRKSVTIAPERETKEVVVKNRRASVVPAFNSAHLKKATSSPVIAIDNVVLTTGPDQGS
ncbi:hypothetical protein BC829DRAFT_442394 [Chytridium lagenaria]|nr:hypothetical protein BC829DRAFT_442394 [Chytridium lagenaria]